MEYVGGEPVKVGAWWGVAAAGGVAWERTGVWANHSLAQPWLERKANLGAHELKCQGREAPI